MILILKNWRRSQIGRSTFVTAFLIKEAIHTSRKCMESLAEQHDFNLIHPDVVKASQALDILIVQQMKYKLAAYKEG
ncbi:aspartyl-phosphate phosphatase Spo0E family protein [Paenibacillus sp. MMO-58]|uniref:aspartyl-phosphate phosphatase Spo0E family protein n=1 Tax=Paenibacillus sp. MMO-58 TaxID=3081290 RepID=UPI003FA794A9